jgi:hypothetical protein
MRALTFVMLFCSVPAAAAELGVGINYLGGQLDYDFGRGHRLELRYLTGKQASAVGTVTTSVAGLRGIQRFRMTGIYHPYAGVELAYVNARAAGDVYKVSGAAPGAFVGIERRFGSRLSAGLDLGPYVFILKDSATRSGQTNFDVVANAFLLFRIY